MKLRGLSPTIALYVLLLGLLCLLPATQATAVDCTNIQKSDSVMDILAACKVPNQLSAPQEVNLALGTLDQAQLDALLKMKDGLNVGIHLRESAVGRIKSGVRDILLEDMCSIWISDNLKLEKIDFNSLNSLKSTTSGPYMQISNNPKLTSIAIPIRTISVPIIAENNGRLDQAGVDTLKGASAGATVDVSDPGVCEFHDLKDAAFLDGCHINKAPKTIKLLPGAKQSATWDDIKLHIEGCLEVTNTKLTTLDFLKDAPGGCPDPVITGNKELCSFGPLTTVDTLTNCDAKCFKWTELSGKTCAVGETDMMIDFNGDASLTRAHIERLVEVNGALSISNFPDDQLTIHLQKMTIPAGASQMGLTIKGDKLNKLEFTHPIVFNPTPAAAVVLLTVETKSWTYNEQEIQKIIADSGIQREQMLFNGQRSSPKTFLNTGIWIPMAIAFGM